MDIIELIEERKIVRFFRAKNKLIVENHVYHVTQRAPGKEKLFLEEADYLYFLHLLKDTVNNFDIDIYAFVLMSNHIHLLLFLKDKSLDKAMKKLFQRYAIYFNNKYKRKGHVFCGNYRCALCNDERYIISASLYIHLNPLKAGIVKNLYNYRWSSLDCYLNIRKKSFIKDDFILSLFNSGKERASKAYKKLLEDCRDSKYKIRLESGREWKEALKTFFEKITKTFKKQDNRRDNLFEDLDDKLEKIRKRKRINNPQEKKALFYAIEQLRSRGFNITDIAEILNISRYKIYRLCNKKSSELKMLHKQNER